MMINTDTMPPRHDAVVAVVAEAVDRLRLLVAVLDMDDFTVTGAYKRTMTDLLGDVAGRLASVSRPATC